MFSYGHTISINRAQSLMSKKGAILVDVRDPISFRDFSVPNSVNVPLNRISTLYTLVKTQHIIIANIDSNDTDVVMALQYLEQGGYYNTYCCKFSKP